MIVSASPSMYSRSMGPSIEELKASMASRSDSIRSPSTASLLQPSASGFNLNLQKEPQRTRINLSQNLNTKSFTSPTISAATPQESLRNAAQTINGFIQKDRIQPDLGELLTGNPDYLK